MALKKSPRREIESARISLEVKSQISHAKSPRKYITTARLSPASGKIVSSKIGQGTGMTGLSLRVSPPRAGGMMNKSDLTRNSSNSKLE
jgi:hypothetical protein